MTFRLSRQQRSQLLLWADEAGRNECCGLILGEGALTKSLILADNVADAPERHFEIDPTTLIAAEKAVRAGEADWIAYFHSHPNGLAKPSSTDAQMAADDGRIWLIIADGEISAWRAVPQSGANERFEAVALIIEG